VPAVLFDLDLFGAIEIPRDGKLGFGDVTPACQGDDGEGDGRAFHTGEGTTAADGAGLRYNRAMAGKRIAERVRRALITAAKVAPVAMTIDASGCDNGLGCAVDDPIRGEYQGRDAGNDASAPLDASDGSADAVDAGRDGGG